MKFEEEMKQEESNRMGESNANQNENDKKVTVKRKNETKKSSEENNNNNDKDKFGIGHNGKKGKITFKKSKLKNLTAKKKNSQ